MFQVKTTHGVVLKRAFESIKDLVVAGNFDCSSKGISLQSMDTTHIALITLYLDSSGFDSYRCDKNMSIGMDLKVLCKALKCVTNDETITIKAADHGETVNILVEDTDQDKASNFELKLKEVDSEHLGVPETDFTATIKLPSHEFQRIMKDLSSVGDTVLIGVTNQAVNFSTIGDVGSANVTLKQKLACKNDEEVLINTKEPIHTGYALRLLLSFTKATTLSPYVTLSIRGDLPMVIEYKIKDIGHVRFYCAPRVENLNSDDEN
jgi:proliferating cell nuclear antigen